MNLVMKFIKAIAFTYAFFFVMLIGLLVIVNLMLFTLR